MPSSTLPHLLSAPYTSFASLHLKCRDGTAPFSTMTLCHKKSECMRSKTNQSYATWTLGMLSNTTAKLLLFGHAFTAHHKNLAETGRAYLLIDPKPLPSSNGGPPTFSISRANQLHLYATAYDFTICKGVTNRTSNSAGGKPCSCVLDKRMGLYCEHHKAQGMTKVVEKKVFSKDTRSLKEGLGAGGMTANFAPKHAAPQHVMKPAQQVKPVAPRLMAPKHASNSLLNPNPRPSKPQPANPYQPKPTASATNSLLRASKPANPYAQKPASANPYAQKPAQVPKKKDAASQHKAMVSRVLQQKSNLSKPNLTRPYPPKPNLILPNQAAPAVDLLGQALSTTKALKSKLVARVTAKTKQVMLPYDGTYSGTVPIPQSRLPPSAAPTARSSHLLDLLAPPKEDELLEKQRELKQRLTGTQPLSSAGKPLNTITNRVSRAKPPASSSSAFDDMFNDPSVDLEAVKKTKSAAHGSLEEMEQLKRTEKLEGLAYKEERQDHAKRKSKGHIETRLVVKYFCDTCKDGVGREFVMAKCKQNRHTMRQERQIVELQEDKERKNRKFNGADGEGMVLGTGIEWNGASVKYWNPGER